MKSVHRHWLQIGLFVVSLVVGTGLNAFWAPIAYAVLPPRPEVPVETPQEHEDEDDAPVIVPAVERLSLSITPADRRYWSVVQWQDAQGYWHDVTGWSGAITDGQIGWWVEAKDFGKGPFRWILLSENQERLLGVSAPFYLPVASQPVSIFVYPDELGIPVPKVLLVW